MSSGREKDSMRLWLLGLLAGNGLLAGLILLEQSFQLRLGAGVTGTSGGVAFTLERFSSRVPLIAVVLSAGCAWSSVYWGRNREPVLILSVVAGLVGGLAGVSLFAAAGDYGWALKTAQDLRGWHRSALLVRLRFDALYAASLGLLCWHLLTIAASWHYGRRLPSFEQSLAQCRCGYDLQGLPGSRCPECGRDVPTRRRG